MACEADGCHPKEIIKWIAGPILAYTKEHFLTLSELKFDRGAFVSFLRMVSEQSLIPNQYKIVMDEMINTGEQPAHIVTRLGFDQGGESDDSIMETIQTVLANNPHVVEQYKGGKETTIGFFVGQVMKALAGKIDPNKAKQLLEQALKQ